MRFSKWVFAPRAVALALVLVVFGGADALAQTFAYVTDNANNLVSVIDTVTQTVTDTVPVGLNPLPVTTTPDGAFLWVGNSNDATISVIEVASNTVVAVVLTGGVSPYSIAFTPDSALAYVTTSAHDVRVIDTVTFLTTAVIPVGTAPISIAIAPDGAFAYVANKFDSTVSIIDTDTNLVINTIPVGSGTDLGRLAITPDGAFVYVANASTGFVYKIDTVSQTVVASILSLNTGPFGVGITPNGAKVYVTHLGEGLAVIDTAIDEVIGAYPFPPVFASPAVTPDGASVYVPVSSVVAIIDTATDAVTNVVPVGGNSGAVAFATPPPPAPTSKEQCKNGGWQTFTNPSFKSQGECIKYVNGL